jgi:hypothetical protein
MTRSIIAALDDLATQLQSQGLIEAATLLDTAANTLEVEAAGLNAAAIPDGLSEELDKAVVSITEKLDEHLGGFESDGRPLSGNDLSAHNDTIKDFLVKCYGELSLTEGENSIKLRDLIDGKMEEFTTLCQEYIKDGLKDSDGLTITIKTESEEVV